MLTISRISRRSSAICSTRPLSRVFGGLALGMLFLILQQRLNKAEQQLFLGQTHAYLGQMVAVVSHELKNPLMIIRGSAERLIKKTGAEEASYILEETDRLNNIVNGYLAFAKAEGPLLQGESIEQFDLAELARTVARHLEERFSGQSIAWSRPMPTDPIPITGYRRSLRQVHSQSAGKRRGELYRDREADQSRH